MPMFSFWFNLLHSQFSSFVIVRVSDPQQVAYGGEILGESVIESEEQIGNKVIQRYEVSYQFVLSPHLLHLIIFYQHFSVCIFDTIYSDYMLPGFCHLLCSPVDILLSCCTLQLTNKLLHYWQQILKYLHILWHCFRPYSCYCCGFFFLSSVPCSYLCVCWLLALKV